VSRLLVVDDDIQMLSALAATLRRKGHTVETASNGIEAIAKLDGAALNAIITDLRMPGMDGWELLHHVRKTQPTLPVIVLSAFGSVRAAVEAIKSGATDFLLKPLSPDALDAALNHLKIVPSSLFCHTRMPTRSTALQAGQSLSEMQRELILITLEQTNGNRTHAAKLLGISLRTLRNRLREYRVEEALA
jgi:DNA-binding NtrC family response regulator